jgi:hypothetical protein
MSATAEWVVVQLAPGRIERAKRRAAEQLARWPEDRGDFRVYGGVPRALRLERARMATEAVAQHLGRRSVPARMKVQWTPRRPENASLKITRVDSETRPDVRWVLVTGREPTFTLIGWARAHEASALGEWRENELRPAYFIEPSRLHPVPLGEAV